LEQSFGRKVGKIDTLVQRRATSGRVLRRQGVLNRQEDNLKLFESFRSCTEFVEIVGFHGLHAQSGKRRSIAFAQTRHNDNNGIQCRALVLNLFFLADP
jgi:hypothetical protein